MYIKRPICISKVLYVYKTSYMFIKGRFAQARIDGFQWLLVNGSRF